MSDTVDRIKELLFDRESRELSDLALRLDRIDQAGRDLRELTASEKRAREEMLVRLEALFERAGTKAQFESSVAEVIDNALRKAELDKHDELADALSPVVVRTVKTEIRNSKDELVEALYPMTGRMVKAYIASAMKDLVNDINRRLETNPVMLRLRSITTGKSMAELAMADANRLHVEELFLIRRGSGELLWRWPDAPETEQSRDHVMSGILTAINEFSTEALGDEGSSLREIDLGERQLYLRASPVYLLAAKCSGIASQPVEAILDEAFLGAIERLHDYAGEEEGKGRERQVFLTDLSGELTRKIEDKHQEASQASGLSPVKALAWVVGLPLLGWIAWVIYADYRTEQVRQIATRAVGSITDLSGYPVRLSVAPLGRSVSVTGLAPTDEAKGEVGRKLAAALPGVEINEQMSVLPSGLSEVEARIAKVRSEMEAGLEAGLKELEPEIAKVRDEVAGLDPRLADTQDAVANLASEQERARISSALARAAHKLGQAGTELPELTRILGSESNAGAARQAAGAVGETRKTIAAAEASLAKGGTFGLSNEITREAARLRSASASLASLLPAGQDRGASTTSEGGSAAERAERLADEADWLVSVIFSATQLAAFKAGLPEPVSVTAPAPTLRERLEAFARANAVFFSDGAAYRDGARAETALRTLAALLKEGDMLVRVVGYTDSKGAAGSNASLSKLRADKVAADLTALGVPADRVIALGRVDQVDISPESGDNSPNRRVEFEIGFDGERSR